MRITKVQQTILLEMEMGAKLQSTEGTNYKTWLEFPDGSIRPIPTKTAEKFCDTFEEDLVFGESEGIRLRASSPKLANQRSPFGLFS